MVEPELDFNSSGSGSVAGRGVGSARSGHRVRGHRRALLKDRIRLRLRFCFCDFLRRAVHPLGHAWRNAFADDCAQPAAARHGNHRRLLGGGNDAVGPSGAGNSYCHCRGGGGRSFGSDDSDVGCRKLCAGSVAQKNSRFLALRRRSCGQCVLRVAPCACGFAGEDHCVETARGIDAGEAGGGESECQWTVPRAATLLWSGKRHPAAGIPRKRCVKNENGGCVGLLQGFQRMAALDAQEILGI